MKNKNFQTKIDSPKPKESQDCQEDSEKNQQLKKLYNRLWEAADELCAHASTLSKSHSTHRLGKKCC